MIAGLSVLALVVARGGSKGLPGKNLMPLGGKPLVAWSVEQARAATLVDRVVISSDDGEIIAAAAAAGAEAPFVRPAELANDQADSVSVALHALDSLERSFDLLVLLQPTSPLRLAADIDTCLRRLVDEGAPSCLGVTEAPCSPYWMLTMDGAGRLMRLLDAPAATRRQDLPAVYVPNGAVYAVRVPWLRHHRAFVGEGTLGHIMPAERSVDIDTILDFHMAETILAHGRS